MKLGAVLMASGRARRFGENKLLHPVDGVPMMERAMNALPPELFTKAAVVSPYSGWRRKGGIGRWKTLPRSRGSP